MKKTSNSRAKALRSSSCKKMQNSGWGRKVFRTSSPWQMVLGMLLLMAEVACAEVEIYTGSSHVFQESGDWQATFHYDYRAVWDMDYLTGTYTYSNLRATVTAYNGNATDVTIPSFLTCRLITKDNGFEEESTYGTFVCPVTAVSGNCRNGGVFIGLQFSGAFDTNVVRVRVPSCVQSIENGAFLPRNEESGETWLASRFNASIEIDFSCLTNIGVWAFGGCTGLPEEINLPNVESIGDLAFESSRGVKRIVVGGKCSSIARRAFKNCSDLESIAVWGKNLTIPMYQGIFEDCGNLRHLELGAGIDFNRDSYYSPYYGGYYLNNDTNLQEVVVHQGMTRIPPGFLEDYYHVGDSSEAFSVSIESPVEYVGAGAFANANITDLSIAFNDCQLDGNAFIGCRGIKGHLDLSGVTSITRDCWEEEWDDEGNDNGYETYCGWQFWKCTELESVSWTPHVPTIPYGCFRDCTGLKTVNVPKEVTEIATEAFGYCTALEDVWFEGAPPAKTALDAFRGVKQGARGHYTTHAAEWEAVIENGMWRGLIFGEVPAPQLRVESANPQKGSLTLAWDEPMAGDGVTYSIYRGEGTDRASAKMVESGLRDKSWTDWDYWEAESAIKPLNYWVVAEGGGYGERESEPVETRHRYGVFVGVNVFAQDWTWTSLLGVPGTLIDLVAHWKPLPNVADQAKLFGELACTRGGFTSVKVLRGKKARKSSLQVALQDIAQKTKTGDYVTLFFNSHGSLSKLAAFGGVTKFRGIVLYDTVYEKEELASDLDKLVHDNDKNGLNVLVFVNTCYSGGAISAEPKDAQIAWIVACRESEEATYNANIGSYLPHFVLKFGWKQGGAGKPGTMATFADLMDYATPLMEQFRQMGFIDEHQEYKNRNVLEHFIAGELWKSEHTGIPEVPVRLKATAEGKAVTVSWANVAQADYYLVRGTAVGGGKSNVAIASNTSCTDDSWATWFGMPCQYEVAAWNELGISDWSQPVTGWRLLDMFVEPLLGHFGLASASELSAIVGTDEYVEFAGNLAAEAVTVDGQKVLSFTAGGDEPWFGQTEESHDGVNAARSGPIGDNQSSWLETEVTGPGTIGFWWKASCEDATLISLDYDDNGNAIGEETVSCYSDFGEFLVDDTRIVVLAGQGDWQYVSFDIGSGTHVLRWQYRKDDAGADGDDCLWLDEVVWSPAPAPVLGDVTPPAGLVKLGEDTDMAFTVEATHPEGGALCWTWRIDGVEVAGVSGKTFEYAAADAGLHEVTCTVTGEGLEGDRTLSWRVGKCHLPRTGLVAFYPFNGKLKDESGNGHHLTNSGGTLASDRFGNPERAIAFDGQNHHAGTRSFALTNTFSVACWVQTAVGKDHSGTGDQSWSYGNYPVYPTHGGDSGTAAGVGFKVGTDGIAIVEHAGFYQPTVLTCDTVIGSGWNHVGLVVEDSTVAHIYLNGQLISTGTLSERTKLFMADVIGGENWGCFTGSEDELCVYDRALTAEEMQLVYLAGLAGDEPCAEDAPWYVSAMTGNDANDGRSWETAKQSIQAAIDMAWEGETIWVADGTYGPIATENKAIEIRSVNGADKTVIDGGGTMRCATLTPNEDAGDFPTSAETNTVLAGFTLRNGYTSACGGGALGGSLNHCVIRDCRADTGGGCRDSFLSHCIVRDNAADDDGGGTSCSIVRDTLVFLNRSGNVGGWKAGAGASHSKLYNCTVTANVVVGDDSNGSDPGAAVDYASEAYNCIIYGNVFSDGLRVHNGCYADVDEGTSWGSSLYTCWTSDPRFVEAVDADYHLAAASPCIDAGDNSYATGETDLDGKPRIVNGMVDVGCYEYMPPQVVTFDAREGRCETGEMSATIGEKYGTLPTPKWSGNAFLGWFTEAEGGEQITEDTMVTAAAELTLYAHWTHQQVTVFLGNGGKPATQATTNTIYAQYGTLPEAKWSGHAFLGWFNAPEGGKRVYTNSTVTLAATRTLYAQWTTEQVTTFKANGGYPATQKTTNTIYSDYGAFPAVKYSGHALVGWFNTPEGGKRIYTNSTVTLAATRTLYAQWTTNQVTTFKGNGGTPELQRTTNAIYTHYGTLPEAAWENHVFLGWFNHPTKGKRVYTNTTVTLAATRSLYAHWTDKQVTTFKGNGGTPKTQATTNTMGTAYGTLPTPKKSGYALLGWFTAADGGSEVTAADIVPVGTSRTLYAHWTDQQVTTFLGNGGTPETQATTNTIYAKYAFPPTPAWDGHTFRGWFNAQEGGKQVFTNSTVTLAAARTLYAHWTTAKGFAITAIAVGANGGEDGPAPRVGRGEEKAENVCQLRFELSAGTEYEIQWTPSMAAEWETVERLVAETDGEVEVEIEVPGGEKGFFRLAAFGDAGEAD